MGESNCRGLGKYCGTSMGIDRRIVGSVDGQMGLISFEQMVVGLLISAARMEFSK
jgi:hypothetical protein